MKMGMITELKPDQMGIGSKIPASGVSRIVMGCWVKSHDMVVI